MIRGTVTGAIAGITLAACLTKPPPPGDEELLPLPLVDDAVGFNGTLYPDSLSAFVPVTITPRSIAQPVRGSVIVGSLRSTWVSTRRTLRFPRCVCMVPNARADGGSGWGCNSR